MESSLQIRRFEHLPSAAEFESQIEAANVPAVNFLIPNANFVISSFSFFSAALCLSSSSELAFSLSDCFIHLPGEKVFSGCVKDWEAVAKWNPSNHGLDYLQVCFCLRLVAICTLFARLNF